MHRLKPLQVISYSFGNLGAGLYYAFNSFLLPFFLILFTQNAILIGWLSSTRSFEQFLIQPLVGGWSDRTRTRIGRRAPFFLIAMPISALILVFTGNLPTDPSFIILAVSGVFLFSLVFNIGIDPYVALLADVTPSEQRGTVNGIAALANLVGQIIVLIAAAILFEAHHELVFYIVAAGLVIGFAIVALGVREKKGQEYADVNQEVRSRTDWRHYARDRWHEDPEAVKLLGVKLIYYIGINAAVPFLTLFVSTEIGKAGWTDMLGTVGLGNSGLAGMDATGIAFLMAVILILFTALFALPVGLLGDRFGKKRIFALGLLVMGTFGFLAAFAHTIPELAFYLLFIGFGNAAQTVLFFPYLTDLIAGDRAGEFQGLAAAAETGGVVISILLAGELINLNLYGLHFRLPLLVTGTFLLLGFVAVLFVKARRPADTPDPVLAEPAIAPTPSA